MAMVSYMHLTEDEDIGRPKKNSSLVGNKRDAGHTRVHKQRQYTDNQHRTQYSVA